MELYLVAFIRNNKIESVIRLTKSVIYAQSAFIFMVRRLGGDKEAKLLLKDFAEGTIDDEVTFNVNSELNIQLTKFPAKCCGVELNL